MFNESDPLIIYMWLSRRIQPLRPHLETAFIFGSVARFAPQPGDCDLLLVSCNPAGAEEWHTLRTVSQELARQFALHFNLTLSITLLTPEEYAENSAVLARIKRREKMLFSRL